MAWERFYGRPPKAASCTVHLFFSTFLKQKIDYVFHCKIPFSLKIYAKNQLLENYFLVHTKVRDLYLHVSDMFYGNFQLP